MAADGAAAADHITVAALPRIEDDDSDGHDADSDRGPDVKFGLLLTSVHDASTPPALFFEGHIFVQAGTPPSLEAGSVLSDKHPYPHLIMGADDGERAPTLWRTGGEEAWSCPRCGMGMRVACPRTTKLDRFTPATDLATS